MIAVGGGIQLVLARYLTRWRRRLPDNGDWIAVAEPEDQGSTNATRDDLQTMWKNMEAMEHDPRIFQLEVVWGWRRTEKWFEDVVCGLDKGDRQAFRDRQHLECNVWGLAA